MQDLLITSRRIRFLERMYLESIFCCIQEFEKMHNEQGARVLMGISALSLS
jgi:hypothetical protein